MINLSNLHLITVHMQKSYIHGLDQSLIKIIWKKCTYAKNIQIFPDIIHLEYSMIGIHTFFVFFQVLL